MRNIIQKFKSFFQSVFVTRFKFSLALSLLVVFVGLALPQFSFFVGDRFIAYPNIDVSILDSQSTLGNLKKSRGLFPTRETRSSVVFFDKENEDQKTEILATILEEVKNRVRFSGLYDVEVRSEVTNEDYAIVLNFPDYYTNVLQLSKWLTAKAEIKFENPDSELPITIKVSDIEGPIELSYLATLGNNLRFRIKAEKVSELQVALNTQGEAGLGFKIDGVQSYSVGFVDSNEQTQRILRAIPITAESFESREIRDFYLNITRSYFASESELSNSLSVSEDVQIVPSQFSTDSTQLIAITSFVGLLGVLAYTATQLKGKSRISYLLVLVSNVALGIILLKLVSSPLSIGTLVGFVLSTIILSQIYSDLAKQTQPEEFEHKLKDFRIMMLYILVILIVVFRLTNHLGALVDVLGAIVTFAFAALVLSIFNIRAIILRR